MKTSILNTEFNFACFECLRDIFPYDPEACFGQAPKVNEFENLYTVTVPFTC